MSARGLFAFGLLASVNVSVLIVLGLRALV